MNLLDLFSGIGGFSLGLERVGFETVAFVEIDPWCRRVLTKHWPGVPRYVDIRDVTADRLRADGIARIDAICGGFPCQDISTAGKGAGLDGERSGLWREYARLIGEIRPRFAIVENVVALRGRGLATVLADLAAIGYDAEWHSVPAAAVGAHHLRDRIWIIATACADDDGEGRERLGLTQQGGEQIVSGLLEPDRVGARRRWQGPADADIDSLGSPDLHGLFGPLARALAESSIPWERPTEPPLLRTIHGVSTRLDRCRVKALGNAVVPLIPELIGRALLEHST